MDVRNSNIVWVGSADQVVVIYFEKPIIFFADDDLSGYVSVGDQSISQKFIRRVDKRNNALHFVPGCEVRREKNIYWIRLPGTENLPSSIAILQRKVKRIEVR